MQSTSRGVSGRGAAAGWPRLGIALGVPLLYNLMVGPYLVEPRTGDAVYALLGFGVMWVLALGLLTFWWRVEGAHPAAVGFRPLPARLVLLAVAIGIGLSLLVPVLSAVTDLLIPLGDGAIIETATRYPAWLLLMGVLTAGITEEILFRAYPLERVDNRWLAAIVALAAFFLMHLPEWPLAHAVGVVLPLGAILTGLYLWQRSLVFVAIVHVMIDLPLVVLALVG